MSIYLYHGSGYDNIDILKPKQPVSNGKNIDKYAVYATNNWQDALIAGLFSSICKNYNKSDLCECSWIQNNQKLQICIPKFVYKEMKTDVNKFVYIYRILPKKLFGKIYDYNSYYTSTKNVPVYGKEVINYKQIYDILQNEKKKKTISIKLV